MVRVLQVVTYMEKGGIENMLMNFYRKIDRTKVQFDFLIHDPNRAEFEDEIESLGGRIYRTPERSLKNFGNYLKGLDEFFRQHTEYKIVHSHMNTLSVFVLRAAKKNGVPVRIAHSHIANDDDGLKGKVKNLLKSQLAKSCTDFFACGEEAGRYMFGDKLFERGKVCIVKNGVDCEKFSFDETQRENIRSRFGFENSLVLGNVASFQERKNQIFILNMLSQLKKSGINTRLLLVGDGETRALLESEAKRLGIEKDVVFAGVVSDVYNYVQAMDIFVFPSVSEGLPLTIVEAQANGLTIFASDAVSSESDLTGLVEFLPLSLGADGWAEKIKESIPFSRQDKTEKIKEAGYDSETSAKFLENFYLEKAEEK